MSVARHRPSLQTFELDTWVTGGQCWCYNLRRGPVAQSVEQRIENPCVGGSIPPQATIIYEIKSAPFIGLGAQSQIPNRVER